MARIWRRGLLNCRFRSRQHLRPACVPRRVGVYVVAQSRGLSRSCDLQFHNETRKLLNLALQGKIKAREIEACLPGKKFARVDWAKARVDEVNNANSELQKMSKPIQ